MSVSSAQGFYELIGKEEFINAWSLVNERPIFWEEFRKLPVPESCPSELLWDIVVLLRFQAGIVLPFKPYVSNIEGDVVWFSVPKSMEIDLQTISKMCHQTSTTWQYVASNKNMYFRLILYLQEVCSALRRDGLALEPSRIKELWMGTDDATTPDEEIVLRLRSLIFDTTRYVHRNITKGLLEELFERLIDGIAYSVAPQTRISKRYQCDFWDSDYTMGRICSLAENSFCKGIVHPIFSSINMSGLFWDHHPLPAFNATIDLLVKKIFYFQHDYPLLAYLPFSSLSEQWESGKITPNSGVSFENILSSNCKFGYDTTNFHAAVLNLYMRELESLSKKVAIFQRFEEQYQEKVVTLAGLNHRQRSILTAALLSPGTQFSISSHRKIHGVSYATARSDLLGLTAKGLFVLKQTDKAFLFSSSPNYLTKIDQLAQAI